MHNNPNFRDDQDTNTDRIFRLSCPYSNMSQGTQKRLLFVCSAGMLRSPTAATIAVKQAANARSCGSTVSLALIPISANLIAWADTVVFMQNENYLEARVKFAGQDDILQVLNQKKLVWNIPDHYNYMDDGLVYILETKVKELINED